MFISEKDRFDIRGKAEIDYQVNDKKIKTGRSQAKIEKLQQYEQNNKDQITMIDVFKEEKRAYSSLQRSLLSYKYENV